HRRLEVEAEPFLYADPPQVGAALRQIQEQHQIKHDRRRQDRVAAQKIYLDLHWIAEPAEDVNVVPALLVITAWRVIVNVDLVADLAVQVGVHLRLQDLLQHSERGTLLGLDRHGIVEDFADALAQEVGRAPSAQ